MTQATITVRTIMAWRYNTGPAVVRSFGVKDSKGREIGGHATMMEATNVEEQRPAGSYYHNDGAKLPLGTVYGYKPGAMRDGKGYGASQGVQWFATPAERDAGVEKYFKNAEARARKAAAK